MGSKAKDEAKHLAYQTHRTQIFRSANLNKSVVCGGKGSNISVLFILHDESVNLRSAHKLVFSNFVPTVGRQQIRFFLRRGGTFFIFTSNAISRVLELRAMASMSNKLTVLVAIYA